MGKRRREHGAFLSCSLSASVLPSGSGYCPPNSDSTLLHCSSSPWGPIITSRSLPLQDWRCDNCLVSGTSDDLVRFLIPAHTSGKSSFIKIS